MTTKLLTALKGIPIAGFANPVQARDLGEDGLAQILNLWHKQGAELGNHTFSHPDLNRVPLAEFQADILLAEPAIRKARGGTQSRYFRHPFLHVGKDEATKQALELFLHEQRYTPAPVTIDTSDWLFARAYTDSTDKPYIRNEYILYLDQIFDFFEKRGLEVVGREFPQVLLLHGNQLNADAMPDVLKMLKRRGYTFIPLHQALNDEAYQLKDGYTGTNGISWIHRWGVAKSMPIVFEPSEPKWLLDGAKSFR